MEQAALWQSWRRREETVNAILFLPFPETLDAFRFPRRVPCG